MLGAGSRERSTAVEEDIERGITGGYRARRGIGARRRCCISDAYNTNASIPIEPGKQFVSNRFDVTLAKPEQAALRITRADAFTIWSSADISHQTEVMDTGDPCWPAFRSNFDAIGARLDLEVACVAQFAEHFRTSFDPNATAPITTGLARFHGTAVRFDIGSDARKVRSAQLLTDLASDRLAPCRRNVGEHGLEIFGEMLEGSADIAHGEIGSSNTEPPIVMASSVVSAGTPAKLSSSTCSSR